MAERGKNQFWIRIGIGIGVGIGAVLITAVVLLSISGISMLFAEEEEVPSGPEVVLNDYVTITVDGYDGFGDATFTIDEEAFIEDNKDKIRFTDALKKRMKKNGLYESGLPYDIADCDEEDAVAYFMDFVFDEISLSASDELANGDSIVLSWAPDLRGKAKEKMDELFGVEIIAKDITMRVEGLGEVTTFDPFEGYEPELQGVNGHGNARSDYGNGGLFWYVVHPYSDLSNGDEVTIRIGYANERMSDEDFFKKHGRIPNVWEKKYTIEGLPENLERMQDIPEYELEKMHEKASENIISGLQEYEGSYTADIQYEGYSFGVGDEGNMLTLIYEIDFSQELVDYYGSSQTFRATYYYYMQWFDLGVSQEGKLVYDIEDFRHSEGTLQIFSEEPTGRWIYSIIDGHETWEYALDEALIMKSMYQDWSFVGERFEE